jgi:hypothetical protein
MLLASNPNSVQAKSLPRAVLAIAEILAPMCAKLLAQSRCLTVGPTQPVNHVLALTFTEDGCITIPALNRGAQHEGDTNATQFRVFVHAQARASGSSANRS